MSIFLQRQLDYGFGNRNANKLIAALVILACLFSQCAIHAQHQNSVMADSALQDHQQVGHDMNHDMSDESDCCADQVQCCEAPDLINSSLLLDHSSVMMLTQFIGLNALMTSRTTAVVNRIALIPPATDPPIRIAHCCYIL